MVKSLPPPVPPPGSLTLWSQFGNGPILLLAAFAASECDLVCDPHRHPSAWLASGAEGRILLGIGLVLGDQYVTGDTLRSVCF